MKMLPSTLLLMMLAFPVFADEPVDQLPPPPDGKSWKLIWQDEFEGGFHDEFAGNKLDETKWTYRPGFPARIVKRNPEANAPDGIYSVEIGEWIDANTARVKVSVYRGPLSAAGHEATVEKKDGKWRVKEYGTFWVS